MPPQTRLGSLAGDKSMVENAHPLLHDDDASHRPDLMKQAHESSLLAKLVPSRWWARLTRDPAVIAGNSLGFFGAHNAGIVKGGAQKRTF